MESERVCVTSPSTAECQRPLLPVKGALFHTSDYKARNMSASVCDLRLQRLERGWRGGVVSLCGWPEDLVLGSTIPHRLVGLVVKASASRAEDPGFESRLRRDFSGVESY